MLGPYRSERHADAPALPARDFIYQPPQQRRRSVFTMGLRMALVLPLVAVRDFMPPAVAALGALIIFVWALAAWRAPKLRKPTILTVRRGALEIADPTANCPVCIPLSALENVELESKTVNQVNHVVRPDGRLVDGEAVAIDVARIAFVLTDRNAPVLLADEFVSHDTMLLCLGKLRMFLRSHGWLPDDERIAAFTETAVTNTSSTEQPSAPALRALGY